MTPARQPSLIVLTRLLLPASCALRPRYAGLRPDGGKGREVPLRLVLDLVLEGEVGQIAVRRVARK